jgi:hypothetical protein
MRSKPRTLERSTLFVGWGVIGGHFQKWLEASSGRPVSTIARACWRRSRGLRRFTSTGNAPSQPRTAGNDRTEPSSASCQLSTPFSTLRTMPLHPTARYIHYREPTKDRSEDPDRNVWQSASEEVSDYLSLISASPATHDHSTTGSQVLSERRRCDARELLLRPQRRVGEPAPGP